jgi:hypothetical protein
VASSRKNWIHFGSQQAGPHIAAILLIVEICHRLRIPIRDYLAAILPGLAELPVNRVAQLTAREYQRILWQRESFGKDPDRERKARHDLYPYLAA